jgi:hypothetical protein
MRSREIEFAIEVFVRRHSAGKSRTFPYEVGRVGLLWVMRDAPRRNPEWIAYRVDAKKVDAIARRETRGRFFVGAMVGEGESDEPVRAAHKSPGCREPTGGSARSWRCSEVVLRHEHKPVRVKSGKAVVPAGGHGICLEGGGRADFS